MEKLLPLQQLNIFSMPSLYKGNNSFSNQKYFLLMIATFSWKFQGSGLFEYQQIFTCSYDGQELYRIPPSVTSLSNN